MEENQTPVSEVEILLREIDLHEYVSNFTEHDINDMEVLASLTDADLEKIGITSLGHRKKILVAAKKNGSGTPASNATGAESQKVDTQTFEQPEKKSGGGVWAFVGVLVAIVLIIIIAGSL